MPIGRIIIIPFLHGKITDDGTLIEPDIDAILERWLDPPPEFRGRDFHITRSGKYSLHDGIVTKLVRVTTDFSPDLEGYDPSDDAELYEEFLAEDGGSAPSEPHKIWIEQCEGAENIEDEFGTQKALDYLVGEKFLNFLEVAETDADFRAEIPAFVAKIKAIFERWQLAQYLETARETEPFDPELFEPQSASLAVSRWPNQDTGGNLPCQKKARSPNEHSSTLSECWKKLFEQERIRLGWNGKAGI
jgi:hypothetical protein